MTKGILDSMSNDGAFLISPASDYMTGQCLMIDGGMIMQ
jgi:NAD(P)-dependent dehydrogenase (short-subunit alcohol dehydrogenase family)